MKTQLKTNDIIFSKEDIFKSTLDRVQAKNIGCSVIIPHVCNNVNAFGAGFAGAVAEQYPEVKDNFHMLGKNQKLGTVQYVSVYKDRNYGYELIFANMIAQNGLKSFNNKRPLSYLALGYCMNHVSGFIRQKTSEDNTIKYEIHCPKFGSGLAGGNWNFIQELIVDAWNNYTTFVYVQ